MARRIDQFQPKMRDIGDLETKKEKFITGWVSATHPLGEERQAEIVWDLIMKVEKLVKRVEELEKRHHSPIIGGPMMR